MGLTKRRSAQVTHDARRQPQVMCLAIEDIYGGVIASRGDETDPSLIELAASIKKHGLLQPILVRKNAQVGRYALVCGARRLAACRLVGIRNVDALVMELSDPEVTACYLEEHMTRRTPGVWQEAEAIRRSGMEPVLSQFALPAAKIEERVAMLALPEAVQRQAASLTLDQARPLLKIRDEQRQLEAASIIAQRDLTGIQAHRLVMGPPCTVPSAKAGRRRAVQEAMETVSQLAQRLNAKRVAASVAMHSQEGGVSIQILLKNGENSPQTGRKRQAQRE